MWRREHVWLHGGSVTDADLSRLRTFLRLQKLTLENTAVTDIGVLELKKNLPNVKIIKKGVQGKTRFQEPLFP